MQKKSKDRIVRLLNQCDVHINQQVNRIIHHPDFQALEASWRSLFFLVSQLQDHKAVTIKVLNISYSEFQNDLTNAIEFDQSQLFKKIYDEEYDHPGGLPYGLLIGNYQVSPRAKEIDALQSMMKIASAAFAPFIANTAPAMFGVNYFSELKATLEYTNLFKLTTYQRWMQLRKEEDARYLALIMPRFLLRQPYNQYSDRIKHRFFQESVKKEQDYLWGNAVFVYALIICHAFAQNSWLAEIRGLPEDRSKMPSRGAIATLPRNYFSVNGGNDLSKIATDIYITDTQEKILSDLGFITLRDHNAIKTSVIYSSQSIQQTQYYIQNIATHNTYLSSLLHYIFCAARFAHYVKVMLRDKIGKFSSSEQCEDYIQQWLLKYCAASQYISDETRAKYPLDEARIKINGDAINPANFRCQLYLKPHYQIDEIQMRLQFITKTMAS